MTKTNFNDKLSNTMGTIIMLTICFLFMVALLGVAVWVVRWSWNFGFGG